jgi:hypothetical protein
VRSRRKTTTKNLWLTALTEPNTRHMNNGPEKIKILPCNIIFLFLGLTLVSSCKTQNDTISIRGRAYSLGKAGACIITRDDKCYYIDAMHEWPHKYESKNLSVKGKLRLVCDTAILSPDVERQRFNGCQNIIDSASYRLTIFGLNKKELKIGD